MLAICLLKFAKHIIVHIIYFCQFADFKPHGNKVQSWKLRFTVMENSDTEFEKDHCGSQSDFTGYVS